MSATDTIATPTISKTPSSGPPQAQTQSTPKKKPFARVIVEFYEDGKDEIHVTGEGHRIQNARFERRIVGIFRAIGKSKLYARHHTHREVTK